ncbi:MAG: carboxypeptidase-like regulatory domain-containing protein, partial [Pirellulales bacterium]
VVEGVIRDPDGKPLLGAQIGANVVGHDLLRWFYQPNDGDGRYRIANLPLGKEIELDADKEGYLRERIKLSLSDPARHVDVTMTPRPRGGSIKGIVVDRDGRAIRAAELTNQGNYSADIRKATSDKAGRFLLDDLFWSYAGYQVAVNAKGFAPAVINVEPGPADAPSEIKIVLDAGHAVSGRVVDEQGRGLDEVLVVWGNPIRHAGGSTSTDASGRFQLDSLPADCPLEFIKEGYSSLSDERLPLDGEGLVNVVLSPQGVIRGEVVDARNGQPVPVFTVRITFSPDSLPTDPQDTLRSDLIEPGQAFESSDGSFELSELVLRMPLQVMVDAEGYE